MKENHKTLLLVAVIIVLIVFFYPKDCGNYTPDIVLNADYEHEDCTCIGLKVRDRVDGDSETSCFGIPTGHSCHTYDPVNLTEFQCE